MRSLSCALFTSRLKYSKHSKTAHQFPSPSPSVPPGAAPPPFSTRPSPLRLINRRNIRILGVLLLNYLAFCDGDDGLLWVLCPDCPVPGPGALSRSLGSLGQLWPVGSPDMSHCGHARSVLVPPPRCLLSLPFEPSRRPQLQSLQVVHDRPGPSPWPSPLTRSNRRWGWRWAGGGPRHRRCVWHGLVAIILGTRLQERAAAAAPPPASSVPPLRSTKTLGISDAYQEPRMLHSNVGCITPLFLDL